GITSDDRERIRAMSRRGWWRRSLKILHELSGIGVGGGLAACLAINYTVPHAATPEFVAAREAIAAIARYVLVPMLPVVPVDRPLDCAATDTVWPRPRSPTTSGSPAPLLVAITFGCSPPTLVVGLFAAPKSTIATACCGLRPQSSAPTSVFATYQMIALPPG